jgi:hypothetical protein
MRELKNVIFMQIGGGRREVNCRLQAVLGEKSLIRFSDKILRLEIKISDMNFA